MTEKYAWYQAPGICEYSQGQKVRFCCFLLCLASYLVPGTRYENDVLLLFFVPCFLQVKLYLYTPLHNLCTRTYIIYRYILIVQHTGVWYQVVMCDLFVNHGKDRKERHAEDSPGSNDRQNDKEEHQQGETPHNAMICARIYRGPGRRLSS